MRSGILLLVPRTARKTAGGYVYHVLNRGVARMQIFDEEHQAPRSMLRELLCDWPTPRPSNWVTRVNHPQTQKQVQALRHCITKGRPYGSTAWVQRIADRLGLTASLRGRGRPRKPD